MLTEAAETDQDRVSISVIDLQILVDQATLHNSATTKEAIAEMDAAIERWASANQRQVEAINRLIEQNRILQRRAAAAPAGQPE